MGFRDDREAMRAHVETLKEQLDEQRDANAQLQKRMDALTKRMDRLEPAPTSPAARQRRTVIFAGAFLVGAAILGFVAYRGMRTEPPDFRAPAPALPEAPTTPAPPPDRPAPFRPPRPSPVPPIAHEPGYQGMAEWAGAVSATEGRDDLAVGNSCVVRAEGRSLAYHLAPERLEVRCGDVLIFERAVSRRDPADPFQRWECEVRGQRESEGGLYGLTCSDRGVRADRPELELDTLTKHVRLWTDDFSVEIALEHAAARTPEQMNPNIEMSLPIGAGLTRSGEVLRSNGPISAGASCQLRLEPADRPNRRHENCRATLRCGGRSVMTQPALCLVDEDLRLTGLRIVDDDSSIAVQGDLESINVASIGEDRTWHAVIRFTE